MLKATWRAAGALGLAFVFAASAAMAQAPTRIRGTIEKVDGSTLSIKSREGQDLTLNLAPNASVSAVIKASLSDIKPNTFVGIAAVSDGKGGWRALEVLVFPESLRGTGEGDRPWDLVPESTMTNATVTDVVTKVDAHTLTLKYKEGEKTFTVPADTPIVTFAPGDKADLKVGAKVFVIGAMKQPDGTYQAARINVGRGIDPPM
jgi:Domain of unknown function (DUF5666)